VSPSGLDGVEILRIFQDAEPAKIGSKNQLRGYRELSIEDIIGWMRQRHAGNAPARIICQYFSEEYATLSLEDQAFADNLKESIPGYDDLLVKRSIAASRLSVDTRSASLSPATA
jgi:hypothetical protein